MTVLRCVVSLYRTVLTCACKVSSCIHTGLILHHGEIPPYVDRTATILDPWASCQIRKTAGCACAGNAGNVFPHHRLQRKLLVSDPGMHHGTCVTHVPWCMPGSLICGGGENDPGIPGACAPAIFVSGKRPINASIYGPSIVHQRVGRAGI